MIKFSCVSVGNRNGVDTLFKENFCMKQINLQLNASFMISFHNLNIPNNNWSRSAAHYRTVHFNSWIIYPRIFRKTFSGLKRNNYPKMCSGIFNSEIIVYAGRFKHILLKWFVLLYNKVRILRQILFTIYF